jgi:hypothetical protein
MSKEQLQHGCVIATETTPFLAMASQRTEGGQPVKRFRKELIRVGTYCTSDGLEFTVDESSIDNWSAQFSRMCSNGVKVPVPTSHTNDSTANRGWMVDIFREGQSLIGVVDLVGEDAIAMAGRTDVSIFSPAHHTDGKGNTYDWPITHVALCTDPVIPGLDGFVPLAASLGKTPDNVPVFIANKENPVAFKFEKIQKALGIEEKLTEANADTAIVASFSGVTDKVATLIGEVKVLKGDLAKAKNPAPVEPKPVDPELLRLSRENHGMRLDGLVATGRITPAVREKLKGVFIGVDGAVLSLSLSSGTSEQFGLVLDALADNDPVTLGEQTKAQTLALSHKTEDQTSPLVVDAERRAKAAQA